jgi:hypothetical protein
MWIILQDILENQTGTVWEFDKFINFLCWSFIKRHDPLKPKYNKKVVDKFNKRFNKYYSNIMKSWE